MAREQLIGYNALQARLHAIGSPLVPSQVMRRLALTTVREAKLLVPRKTGNLGRSIHVAAITPYEARVVASAGYAAFVEFGTRGGQVIVPKNARALAWPTGGAGGPNARLSGRPRKGIGRGGMAFARRVIRGATRKQPFMMPGARRAIATAGLANEVISVWNKAG